MPRGTNLGLELQVTHSDLNQSPSPSPLPSAPTQGSGQGPGLTPLPEGHSADEWWSCGAGRFTSNGKESPCDEGTGPQLVVQGADIQIKASFCPDQRSVCTQMQNFLLRPSAVTDVRLKPCNPPPPLHPPTPANHMCMACPCPAVVSWFPISSAAGKYEKGIDM